MKTSKLILLSVLILVSESQGLRDLPHKGLLDEFLQVVLETIPADYLCGADKAKIQNELTPSAAFQLKCADDKLVQLTVEITKTEFWLKLDKAVLFYFEKKDLRFFYKGFFQYKMNYKDDCKEKCQISPDQVAKLVALGEFNSADDAMKVEISSESKSTYQFKFLMNENYDVYEFKVRGGPTCKFDQKDVLFMNHNKDIYRFVVAPMDQVKLFDAAGFSVGRYRHFYMLPKVFFQLTTVEYVDKSSAEHVEFYLTKRVSDSNDAPVVTLSVIEKEANVYTIYYTGTIKCLLTLEEAELFAKEMDRWIKKNKEPHYFTCNYPTGEDVHKILCYQNRLIL